MTANSEDLRGRPNPGGFKAGFDPRRHIPLDQFGRRADIEALCQIHTPAAVTVLASILQDESEPAKHRIAAAECLISHGHGRAVDRTAMLVNVGGGNGGAPADLSEEQLLSALVRALPENRPVLEHSGDS